MFINYNSCENKKDRNKSHENNLKQDLNINNVHTNSLRNLFEKALKRIKNLYSWVS